MSPEIRDHKRHAWCAGYCGKMHPVAEMSYVAPGFYDRMCDECREKAEQ